MFFSAKDKKPTNKKILIAPLDWGLGHATRCIPIIHELNNKGLTVIIGASGAIKVLLTQEFPNNLFVALPAYNIRYSKSSFWLNWQLFIQIPKIISVIIKEHNLLKKIIKTHSIGTVISDNRFGLFNNAIQCFYITHQISFKSSNRIFNTVAAKIHHWFIKKYSMCLVPDFEDEKSIAGELSHTKYGTKLNLRYIGCLSRFEKLQNVEKRYDLMILISGPEPQRTVFEKAMLQQLLNFKGKVIFIRGLPGRLEPLKNKESYKQNIVFKNHVNAQELAVLIQETGLIICRSGYTTIMDLVKLKQKAILIPTPGQSEQEYLAKYLFQKGIFYTTKQNNLNLREALLKASQYAYNLPEIDMAVSSGIVYSLFVE